MTDTKHILLFGAGKSASVLIHYFKKLVTEKNWFLTVVDSNLETVVQKTNNHPHIYPVGLDIKDDEPRYDLISKADMVISLMPPALHYLIAKDCLIAGKHLLTASYIDENLKAMHKDIENAGLLFLCEMGLDPGIDHMSAMKLVHEIKAKGGQISSFKSHCGGLVAPESDDNPWHYKISWNPRNVVMAGKAGAVYKEANNIITKNYNQLFGENDLVDIEGLGKLAYYPNRDSLSYIPIYELDEAATFIRTTLRYPSFCNGWKYIIDCKLTDEEKLYATDGMRLTDFYATYFKRYNLSPTSDDLLQKQMEFLGWNDSSVINKGLCSAADVLQFALEEKLMLEPTDKDMVVMLHEIEFGLNGTNYLQKSQLVIKGEDAVQTAMAKTVGLPLGIAAKLILENKLAITGLRIPVTADIYNLVLPELAKEGVLFEDTIL